MINLGNLILPTTIDYDSRANSIQLELPDYGTFDYLENSECSLQITFQGTHIFIDYYCEDDFLLSEKFDIDQFASGDLMEESFEDIQKRALEQLKEFIQQ